MTEKTLTMDRDDLEFIANGLRDLADQQDAKIMEEAEGEDQMEMAMLAERNRNLSERLLALLD